MRSYKELNYLDRRLVSTYIQNTETTLDSTLSAITPKQLYLFTSSPDCLGRAVIFMVCFVWMIVVAKGEAARFAQGAAKKELCDYRATGRIEGKKDVVRGVSGCLTGMAVCN